MSGSGGRILLYCLGVFIYAYFVCVMTRAHAGISPITSLPYVITELSGLTLGTTQFIVNAVLVVLQMALLRRKFQRFQLLQIAASLVFSVFIDIIMPFTEVFEAADAAASVCVFALAVAGMSVGLGVMTMCDLILLPGDGLAKAAADVCGRDFGWAKRVCDCSFAALSASLSLLCTGRVIGIQWGTVAAALCLGPLVRIVVRILKMRGCF